MTVTTPQIQDGTARTEDTTNIHWQFVQKFRPDGLLSCSNAREQTGQVHRMALPSFADKGRAEKRVRPYNYSIIRIVEGQGADRGPLHPSGRIRETAPSAIVPFRQRPTLKVIERWPNHRRFYQSAIPVDRIGAITT